MTNRSVCQGCGRKACIPTCSYAKKFRGDAAAYRSLTHHAVHGCNQTPIQRPAYENRCGGCSQPEDKTPPKPTVEPCPQPKKMCIEFTNNTQITDSETGEVRELIANHLKPVSMLVDAAVGQVYLDCGMARECGTCNSAAPAKRGKTVSKEQILAHLSAEWDELIEDSPHHESAC